MRAIVHTKFGSPDVLRLEDVDKPVPKENEILIKVAAASVNAYDWHFLRADPFFIRFMGAGLFRPKYRILGSDIAGRVEAVGGKATQFRPGDDVFGIGGHGGFAEYDCVAESRCALKPAAVTYEDAAAAPMAALTALQGLRDVGRIRAGQKVLINGASGGVGTYAVQLAKVFGTEVTGVCTTTKMDLVRSAGADHVIDHTRDDITTMGQRYDLIFDVAAYRSLLRYKRILNPGGIYVMAGGARMLQSLFFSMTGSKSLKSMMTRISQKDLVFIGELLEKGKIKSIIGKRYPLSETAQAIRDLEEGRVRGKAVIVIAQRQREG